MRLQSAIFTLGDTLFTPDGAAREGLDKTLSLFKMEGVWLGAVTALSAEDAQKALEKAGLNSYFRFVLTESVALCKADSGTMFERAMKRLHSHCCQILCEFWNNDRIRRFLVFVAVFLNGDMVRI